MEESELTKKAIEELMREMGENGSAQNAPQERKKNPLGRRPTLHRRFLDRTVNSVIQHNKREIERTKTSSRQMLHEMDDIYRRRAKIAYFNGAGTKKHCDRKKHANRSRSRSRSGSKSSRSSSDSGSNNRRRHKKKRKSKKHKSKKSKRRKRSSSSSSSSSRTHASSDSKSPLNNSSRKLCEGDYVDGILPQYASYMQTASFPLAAMAFAYGQHMQEMMYGTTSRRVDTATSKDSLQDNLSDSSSNASLTKELALTDDDDNSDVKDDRHNAGCMLTFDISSSDDEEAKAVTNQQNKHLNSTNKKISDCDNDSSASCISVDSVNNNEDIVNNNSNSKATSKYLETLDNVPVVLTSSDSEGETVEIISVQKVKSHQITVDLTDD